MKTFTEEEVAIMLAAYSSSDLGTFNIAEVKEQWPNCFPSMVETAKEWMKTSNDTVAKRAEVWFAKVVSKDYANILRKHSPDTRGKNDEEIYRYIKIKK